MLRAGSNGPKKVRIRSGTIDHRRIRVPKKRQLQSLSPRKEEQHENLYDTETDH